MEQDHITIYELVGGDSTFRKLVDAFYKRVENDPTIRGMFPEDLEEGKEYQFLFLTQYFGGPSRYIESRGHPRLRMRHAPFSIDQRAAEAWLSHMLEAVDEAGIEEPARSTMRDYFERAAPFMINTWQPKA
jgi:hemoglobin